MENTFVYLKLTPRRGSLTIFGRTWAASGDILKISSNEYNVYLQLMVSNGLLQYSTEAEYNAQHPA